MKVLPTNPSGMYSPVNIECAPFVQCSESIRSLNAPVLAALAIERVLLRASSNKDQYDHHLARLDVLSSQVER